MKLSSQNGGYKLIELMFTLAISSVVGLIIYSIFYSGLVLGAKNTAINTAHHQARVAMLDMLEDIHGAVSLPALIGPSASATPYPSPPAHAEGISFQKWASGPHKLKPGADVAVGATQIRIVVTSNAYPAIGQHVVIPSHQIEADITGVSGTSADYTLTLNNIYGPSVTPAVTYPASSMPIAISGTGSSAGDITCFITDKCSYTVAGTTGSYTLSWNSAGGTRTAGNDITNATPFSIPTTPAGALYYRFVAAIDLSTSDVTYSNRGFKSANIMLNGQVPQKVRLTTFQ
jgi:hypothetical protein